MRRIGISLFVMAVAWPAAAAEFDAKPIDDIVQKAMAEFPAPGAAVVIVQDDRVVYLKGFGVREQGKSDPVTPDTVFPIASCSKAFTATAAAMLVDEGKLAWDDKVRTHLDFFRLADDVADREVTIRDLLSHRTGMPRHDLLWAGRTADSTDVIKHWSKAKPSTSYRSTWEYSNVPFTTTGQVVGKLNGSDWAAATRKRIFGPLGMTHSSATAKEGQAATEHVSPHYYGFDKTIRPVPWDDIDSAGGAGCINSTARDMGRWLRFQLGGGKLDGNRYVSEKALNETHSPQMLVKPEGPFAIYFPAKVTHFTTYGLGWFVHDYRGHKTISHGGTLSGTRAQCMMVPEKKLGVVVLGNLRPSFLTEAVAKAVLDKVLGLPEENWVAFHKGQFSTLEFQVAAGRIKRATARRPDTKPSLPLARYTGTFEEPAYGPTTITLDGDKQLMVKWGNYTFRLEHYHFDTFTAVPVDPKAGIFAFDRSTFEMLFRLGSDGEVESIKFLEQDFRRTKPPTP